MYHAEMKWPPDLALPKTPIPDFIKEKNGELEILYLTLRRADQRVLDELFELITQHHAAMKHAENLLPMESLLLMMALEHRKSVQHELVRLVEEVNKLRREIEELRKSKA
jgi:hypothetical protein